MVNPSSIHAALERARAHAPFLQLALQRETELADVFAAGRLPLPFAREDGEATMPVPTQLRLARRRLALSVAIGDLAGAYDLTDVTLILSTFADHALDAAIRTAIAERTPDVEPRGFAAIALGKQGSHELNYSSDIDPILIFDPATLPCRPREDVGEAAVRIARRVVEILQNRDGDGYVLRVDLRLRPSPEATPIALPVDAAISYYESLALPWERAAFIRARAAAGDLALGERFLAAIQPFIWRRALDFGAIGEIRGISRRIRDHHAHGQAFGAGYDLKRGRGGIREIEFFAQIHQLIHGGRDVSVRAPATRDALAALAAAGWIGASEATALSQAYTLLRTIEHRVQMVEDRQTHRLPEGAALDSLAQLHGLDDGAALLALLRPHVERVGAIYDALDPAEGAAMSFSAEHLAAQLAAAGFADPSGAARAIGQWRAGIYPALRSEAARSALEAVLPGLIEALGQAPDPSTAVARLDSMLSHLSSAINFFRLLQARPALARLLALILSHAETLAQALARRPELFDGLIDATALGPVGDVAALAAEMHGGQDYQALLDHVRRIVGEKRFALGTQIVAAASDPLAVAAGYARVAEAATEVLAAATVSEFVAVHGSVPDSELVILALGRFGGAALTHASDLDLIYLFTGDYRLESDGTKPLGAVLYYNRLAQRITGALSAPTASGPLYEIDTRLRPSGTQGPLSVSLDGFSRYQRESAWTWEHMALTRARPVFGSARARAEVQSVIDAVLCGERPQRDIVADAMAMRADMAKHKPPAGPLDAKLLPGGLVDLEFAVHVRQLTCLAGFSSSLSEAIGALAAAGLAPPTLGDAEALLTRLLVTLRLVAPDAAIPPAPTQRLIAGALGMADWDGVVASLAATRQEVVDFLVAVATGDRI
ncbi:bifunctional [glutamine synthetase] adenylyltransferase/[glutamine synthetase]-adenylyl-L-tyrosine phosphorylase [Sphingomonas sp. BAUL-RG-20F-R05-02]|uniref:bifunctional [glutamine synthetase] adenylyltransferase/[glutamine synthetase]-adenylyl-L-tyrosine phosphorylase n=1 Tax=Sphingomonas sp. BAUL-RG-20F-R05-02 TaxID=2914830 RepID=UPI001F567A12|nr:bifunctional [glutamine synthetase] adenylyltransferase/[glutamine synthetase]-adenylyl-L-tyrosine phosphorylase [Sphingomonas sp. BAUL-RG-20F-R05-02]